MSIYMDDDITWNHIEIRDILGDCDIYINGKKFDPDISDINEFTKKPTERIKIPWK